MKLRDIAQLVNGRIIGSPDADIRGASGIKDARQGEITFLSAKKSTALARQTNASAILAKEEIRDTAANIVVVDNPVLAFAKVLEVFHKKPFKPLGVSRGAVIGSGVLFGDSISIYPLACIQDNVSIGDRTVIHPHVYVGENVTIGRDSVIYPNVTIREGVTVGNNVIIHPGAVIGADGFGYVQEKGRHYKIPQVGGVVIEDDVEIGANVTIDRATTGNTVIGSGSKVDNLVQIAHNVKIGRNCIIVAQVGIGGSSEISDGAVLAGQVGIKDHVKIGKGVMVGAQSGVIQDIPDGQIYSGTFAMPHRTWLKAYSHYARLPEYVRRLIDMEKKCSGRNT